MRDTYTREVSTHSKSQKSHHDGKEVADEDAAIAKTSGEIFHQNGFQQYVIRFSSNSLSDRWIASCKSDCDACWDHLIEMCDTTKLMPVLPIHKKHPYPIYPTVLFEEAHMYMDRQKDQRMGL